MLEKEIKIIPGYEEYSANSDGHIISNKSSKILKARPTKDGYLKINVQNNGIYKTYKIHQLIAITFIGPYPKSKQVNHKNGIKTDNRAENLEYVTPKENINHAIKNGLMNNCLALLDERGSSNPKAKLVEEQVLKIRQLYVKQSKSNNIYTLAKQFNVSPDTIHLIVNRKTWTHI